MGNQYREGMVYIGPAGHIIHTPAQPEVLPELMDKWFEFVEQGSGDVLLRSFIAHFYFVYIHPFCDGNGRAARILNAFPALSWWLQKNEELAVGQCH